MTQQAYEQTVKQQEEIEYLLSGEAYSKWLYENYTINNGDMLVNLLENADVALIYLKEHGLPLDAEIGDF